MRRKSWVLSSVILGGMCFLFAPQQSWSQAHSALPPAIVNHGELPDAPGEQVQSAGQPAPNAPQPPAKAGAEAPSITVFANPEQIATEQVHLAEQQRVLGIIPNFYVVYDSKGAVPLSTKLKFQMAYKVALDPMFILGDAALAGINQAGDTPN